MRSQPIDFNKDRLVDSFIAFDVETSGTIAGVNEILEISAIRFVNGQIEGSYTSLVKNTKPIPEVASRVNGIYEHMLKDAPPIEEALKKFTEFCGEHLLVAHNAPFDCNFISKACEKHEISGPQGLAVCTLSISRKTLSGMANYKLGTLLSVLGIEVGTLHRAEADSIGCGELLLKLIRKMDLTGRVKIEQLVNLTGREITFPQFKREPKQMGLF